MSNADKYIDKYKELEEIVHSTYNIKDEDSISYYLRNNAKFKNFKDEIKYCQDVRNLLSHKKKIGNSFPVEPSDNMLEFIENLIKKIKNRSKCKDIQVKKSDIFWKSLNGNVMESMEHMKNKMYTHVPILENDRVIGVFDENSIFNYLATDKIIEINEKLTFEDIRKYLSIKDRDMEDFIFFGANRYVEDLEKEFESSFKKGRRIGITFITTNGKPTEPLQGIITPWDIVANKTI